MELLPKSQRGERLDSWKAIANYLGKTVRTVQRWEKQAGLPVRRIDPDSSASVYAYTNELDRWLTRRNLTLLGGGQELRKPEPRDAHATAPASKLASELDVAPRPPRFRPAVWALSAMALLLAVGTWYATSRPRPQEQPQAVSLPWVLQPRLLTTDPGDERSPALSPDGRQVAYIAVGVDGQTDIFSRFVDLEGSQRLTDSAEVEETVVWSPDGLNLAYIRKSGPGQRQLRLMSAVGREDRLLYEFQIPSYLDAARTISISLDWSPDGASLLFPGGPSGQYGMQLFLLNLADRRVEPLTEYRSKYRDNTAAFSPDGRRVAFVRSPLFGLIGTLAVLDLDPAHPISSRITELPGMGAWNSEPAWTVDGREIVFSSGLWPRNRLGRVAADGSAPPSLLTGIDVGASQPSIAPIIGSGVQDGSWRLVYSMTDMQNDIWRIDLAGDAPDELLIASSQRERFPEYGPGGRITFLSDRGGYREAYEFDEKTRNWTQWTDLKSNYIRSPRFSPDGGTLAYVAGSQGQFTTRLQTQPLSPSRSLYREGFQDAGLAWSRDGSRLYVLSQSEEDSAYSLWSIDIAGGNRQLLANAALTPLGEDPSGARLYLLSGQAGDSRLWVMNLVDHAYAEVDLGGEQQHSFALSGDGIYYIDQQGEESRIMRIGWDGESMREIKRLDQEPEHGMAVSEDGRFALLSRIVQRGSDLMVAEFMGSEEYLGSE